MKTWLAFMNKTWWIDLAEVIDTLRIVPRIVLFTGGGWSLYYSGVLIIWYMHLPIPAQTVQASAFCFGALAAIGTIFKQIYDIYSGAGTDWAAQRAALGISSSATTQVATVTTETVKK